MEMKELSTNSSASCQLLQFKSVIQTALVMTLKLCNDNQLALRVCFVRFVHKRYTYSCITLISVVSYLAKALETRDISNFVHLSLYVAVFGSLRL